MTVEQINKQLERAQAHADKDVSRDLAIIIESDGDAYRAFISPTIDNMRKHIKRNNFEPKQAILAFYNVVVNCLSWRRFVHLYTYNLQCVDVPTRWDTAVILLNSFMEEIEYNEQA
jgi:hypothetical protein